MEQATRGEMTTLQGAFIESGTKLYAGEVGFRPYLSTHYLHGARHLAAMAKDLEEKPDAIKAFDVNHRTYVVSAIMLVANFMEAAINEVYGDAADGHLGYIENLHPDHIAALKCYWESTEAKGIHVSIMQKYQTALVLVGKLAFDPGKAPLQDADKFITLRNSLVHFKPKTYTVPDQNKLTKILKDRIGARINGVVKYPLNPFAEGDKGTMALDRILGHGTAAWSLDSAIAFTDEFFRRVGATPNYQSA